MKHSRFTVKAVFRESDFGDDYYRITLYLRVKVKFLMFKWYKNKAVCSTSVEPDYPCNNTPESIVEYLFNLFRTNQRNKRKQLWFIKEMNRIQLP